MFIGVIESSAREMIFQGDADEFLEMMGYDEEIQECLNNLSSPNSPTKRRVGEYILIRGKR